MLKLIYGAGLFCTAVALVGCGGSGSSTSPNDGSSSSKGKSSSSVKPETVSMAEFATMTCSEAIGWKKVQVEELGIVYTCASMDVAGTLVWSWYPVLDSEEELGNCTTSENMGKIYLIPDENAIFSCAGNGWVRYDLSVDIDDGDDDDGDDDDDSEKSSSSKKGNSSSSSAVVPAQKAVEFAEGILWQPSYGKRARTFFNLVDEYNFYSPTSETKDTSGWWEKYVDDVDDGASVAKGVFREDYLDLSITLNYINWYKVGSGTSAYNAPDPYPYAGFQFPISPIAGGYADLSSWTGVCITYASDEKFAFAVRSYKTDAGDGMHWEKALSASSTPKTVEISFSTLTRSTYATTEVTRANAIKQVTGFQIAYRNDEANRTCSATVYTASECNDRIISASNSIQIYKIGKTGSCSASNGGGNEL